jgi:hypothetical protein
MKKEGLFLNENRVGKYSIFTPISSYFVVNVFKPHFQLYIRICLSYWFPFGCLLKYVLFEKEMQIFKMKKKHNFILLEFSTM